MDQIFSKVGSYWMSQKASNELSSVGNDINIQNLVKEQHHQADIPFPGRKCSLYVGSSIEEGTKWMVNKIKGKMQKPLPELLKEYDMAIGIFPKDATHYEFDEKTGKLTVYVPQVCEVGYRDSSVLRFFTTITACLERGKLIDIEGMKTKVVIWVKVTAIKSEGSKLHVTAGMRKTRNREAYEVLREGVIADKF